MCMHPYQFAPTNLSLNTTALTPRWQINCPTGTLHSPARQDWLLPPGSCLSALGLQPSGQPSSTAAAQSSRAALQNLQRGAGQHHPLHPLPPFLPGCLCSHDEWTSESIRILHLKPVNEWKLQQQASDEYLIPTTLAFSSLSPQSREQCVQPVCCLYRQPGGQDPKTSELSHFLLK